MLTFSRCALWFQRINEKRLPKQTATYCFHNLRLCAAHFVKKDVKVHRTKKTLDWEALPFPINR